MGGDEGAGGVEVVGGLEGDELDALHSALGDPREGPGRGELEQAGDAELEQGRHGQVPADRVAHLRDEPGEGVGAVRHGAAVAVGQQGRPRGLNGDLVGGVAQRVDGGRHVVGVEGAGDREGDHPGLGRRVGRQGLQLLHRAGGDGLPRAVGVGRGEAVALEGGGDLVGVAADDGAHPRGGQRARLGHGAAADPDEPDGVLLAQHAGEGGGGELADRVAGEDPGSSYTVGLPERVGGQQPRGDDERLGDGGVLDGVGVRRRAVGDEVETHRPRTSPVEPARAARPARATG